MSCVVCFVYFSREKEKKQQKLTSERENTQRNKTVSIKGQEKNVELAQQGYEIARTRFENGLGTQLEVNDADLVLRRASLNKLQAIYELRIAEVELQMILGNK